MPSASLQRTSYTGQWQSQAIDIATTTLGSGPSVLLLPAFGTVSIRDWRP